MTKTKGVIFIILFTVALIIVGRILYYQQLSESSEIQNTERTDQTTPTTTSSTTSVLGASKAPSQENSSAIKNSLTEYTKENSLKHLALTKENIIWQTNYERVKNGREPLTTDELLVNSAREKNTDMLTYQYFDHSRRTTPPVGFDTFIDNQNYEFIKIGENLAKGDFSTSVEVVSAWMRSPSHRRNILDPIYHDIGVHIKNGVMDDRNVTLITQHLGDPKSSCPTVNSATKQAIDTLRNQISNLQETINSEQKQVTQSSEMFDPRFNELVERYNSLITIYNESIETMGELVKDYNNQVLRYDQCIQGKR